MELPAGQQAIGEGLIWIPVSVGELVDKLTILHLKCRHLSGEALVHVQAEQALLLAVLAEAAVPLDPGLQGDLQRVNAALWEVEEQLRIRERQGDFGAEFVQLAREVYQLNDRRHALKRSISASCGSALIEEKSYG
jgi:hypothetical protein